MTVAEDFYQVLGVARDADPDTIKKAYRRLARRYHPDVNPGNREAEERFKQVSQAHDVLTDPEKRKLFDEFGAEALSPGFDAQQARAYQQWSASGGGRSGAGGFGRFNNLDDVFGGIFGNARRGPQPGADVEAELEVDLLDAIRGTSTQIRIEHPIACSSCHGSGDDPSSMSPCPECQGTGQVHVGRGPVHLTRSCSRCAATGRVAARRCATCNGSGERRQREQLNVRIPAGVDNGSRVRVAGKGGPGRDGGPPGDLFIVVHVRPHPLLERRGDDLHMDLPVTVAEAIRGAAIAVPTPDGPIKVKVAPGSQSGKRMRVRGRGVPALRGGERGDLYLRLLVQVPTADAGLDEALDAIESKYSQPVRGDLRL